MRIVLDDGPLTIIMALESHDYCRRQWGCVPVNIPRAIGTPSSEGQSVDFESAHWHEFAAGRSPHHSTKIRRDGFSTTGISRSGGLETTHNQAYLVSPRSA